MFLEKSGKLPVALSKCHTQYCIVAEDLQISITFRIRNGLLDIELYILYMEHITTHVAISCPIESSQFERNNGVHCGTLSPTVVCCVHEY